MAQPLEAVREVGARLITSGCKGMAGLAGQVEEGLRENGIGDVQVLDPAVVAAKVVEALADMGLFHRKRTYPAPLEKEIMGRQA